MSTTLSYGFVKPQNGDKGAPLFTALENDIQQLNDHTHNGVNSAQLTTASIVVVTQAVASGSWVLDANGHYKQVVTLPGTLEYDEIFISMRDGSGNEVLPTIEKVSATTYRVWTIDNSVGYTAVYR